MAAARLLRRVGAACGLVATGGLLAAAPWAVSAGNSATCQQLARSIDHTLLATDATEADVQVLCAEAHQFGFKTVCVNGAFVRTARQFLDELGATDVGVAAVVGFPLGASSAAIKAEEARQAIEDGASEIDMVMAVGRIKQGRDGVGYPAVVRDISAVVEVCKRHGTVCKVILETGLLTDEERDLGCFLAGMAGADFVKTSTGFSKAGGATVEDVQAMRRESDKAYGMKVKASGGIRNYSQARAMLEAGADRLGVSRGVEIMEQCMKENGVQAVDWRKGAGSSSRWAVATRPLEQAGGARKSDY